MSHLDTAYKLGAHQAMQDFQAEVEKIAAPPPPPPVAGPPAAGPPPRAPGTAPVAPILSPGLDQAQGRR